MAKTICFDFDWVIHWYREGWKDWTIYDEPVPWIKDLIEKLMKEWYKVVICSTRAFYPSDREKIEERLDKYWFPKIDVFSNKPIAAMYIDDRGIRFKWDTGDLYSQIINFQTWLEQGLRPRPMWNESPRW